MNEVAKYTYSQLRDAKESIGRNMESLDIFEVYVNQNQNNLVISSSDWTQDKMSEAISIAGIDNENIKFLTVNQNTIDNAFFPDVSANEAEEVGTKALAPLSGGGIKYTVGEVVVLSFLTVPIVWNKSSSNKK